MAAPLVYLFTSDKYVSNLFMSLLKVFVSSTLNRWSGRYIRRACMKQQERFTVGASAVLTAKRQALHIVPVYLRQLIINY